MNNLVHVFLNQSDCRNMKISGSEKTKAKYWTDEEIEYLIKNVDVPDKEVAYNLGRSLLSVKNKRQKLERQQKIGYQK